MTAEDVHEAKKTMSERVPQSLWLELLGAEIRYRDALGYRTRSIEAGEGEPVVLLHGLSGHAETWARTVTGLAEKGLRVYAIDMLGQGLTAKPLVDYSVPLLADHVRGFLDAIGAPGAHLVGQSLGGWVAAWLAIHSPERVVSLISVTGAGLQLTDDGAALTERVGRQVGDATRRALEQPTKASVRARLEWLMHSPDVVTDELVETRFRMYTRPDFVAVADRLIDSFTAEPSPHTMLTAERLTQIACPTLILWSRQNPTMPWEVARRASELIPGAAWYLMEDAGHWPQYEKPAEFLHVVGEFLRSVVRGPNTAGGH